MTQMYYKSEMQGVAPHSQFSSLKHMSTSLESAVHEGCFLSPQLCYKGQS